MRKSIFVKYGYLWVTLALFIGSLVGHWVFAWYSYVQEQSAHAEAITIQEYVIQTGRDTLENWQSDMILKKLDPENYSRIIKQLEEKYPKA